MKGFKTDSVTISTDEKEPRVKVLVTGGRKYGHKNTDAVMLLNDELDQLHAMLGITDLAHGAAEGADSLADQWAVANKVRVHRFKADWDKYGLAAGPARNELMYKVFKPDLVVAFPGGSGTENMCKVATLGGTNVRYVGRVR